MKLTTDDKEKVANWLNARCGQLRCFCCGQARWQMLDAASIAIGFDTHTTRFHYHDGIPQVALACENCGHMVYFAAVLIGLKPDTPPPAPAPPPPGTPPAGA